ncbi:MAG: hypothetical protein ACOC0V_01475, partial [Oceanicaulis sp.]
VYLADGRPEAALRAIEQTRIAGLPADLVGERRLLQARALAEVGRTDHALELIAADESEDANRLRARIAWNARQWAEAGRRAESLLGDRWRGEDALEAQESHDVLRALIAYALANDRAGTDRIAARYGPLMARTDHAGAFAMVAERTMTAGDARLAGLAADLAQIEDAESLMRGFRGEAGTAPDASNPS